MADDIKSGLRRGGGACWALAFLVADYELTDVCSARTAEVTGLVIEVLDVLDGELDGDALATISDGPAWHWEYVWFHHHRGCGCGTTAAMLQKPPQALLPDDASRCPDQVADAYGSGLSFFKGPVEDCRWIQTWRTQGGSKQGGGSY
jgi:hypothetical protein